MSTLCQRYKYSVYTDPVSYTTGFGYSKYVNKQTFKKSKISINPHAFKMA